MPLPRTVAGPRAVERVLEPEGGRLPGFGHIRCECERCGSHLKAVVVDDLLNGTCAVCGGTEIAPVTD